MPRIAHTPECYLASPHFVAKHGTAFLSVRAWTRNGEQQLDYKLDLQGNSIGLPTQSSLPVIDVAADRQAFSSDGSEKVVAAHEGGIGSICLKRVGGEVLVFRAMAIAAAPVLLTTTSGTWIAFHHNLREDTLTQDVAKWIAIRFVDLCGRVFEPSAAMLDRDRDREGEEQGFEFPALALGTGGALTIVGRGSHNIWRQDLDHQGFHSRESLSDGSWGARGRHISLLCRDEDLLVAFRDGQGINVLQQKTPNGSSPELRVAIVDLTSRQEGTTPSWNRLEDPALRHGLHTYFGDIQQHSAHSDGLGTADEAYLRARYQYGDDFVALTDHESFLGKRTSPSEWQFLQEVADHHCAPGDFATLLAYEWTGKMHPGPGHKCVYLPHHGLPIVSRDQVSDGGELVQRIKTQGGFAGPHHVGWSGCDESGHDPEGQPVWEICSCHGCYEEADSHLGFRGEHVEQFLGPMLRRGHRFGFVASSDSHGLLWHHGECRKRDPCRTGLTAVQAKTLDRASIFQAIKERRCYATSGAKIVLDFRGNGLPMGSVVLGPGPLVIEAEVIGKSTLASVELVTAEGSVRQGAISGRQGRLEATITASYCYLRVTQNDGEMAWSSPIWLAAD